MSSRGSSGLLGMFSTAVVDQVMLSAANFFIGFLLIRNTSDNDYGLFVLTQSTITLLLAGQGAWLSGPVVVTAPKKSPDDRRAMIGAVEAMQRRILRWLSAVVILSSAVAYAFGFVPGEIAVVIGLGAVASWMALHRDYLRSILLVYMRTRMLFVADAVYVVLLVIGAFVAAYGPEPAVVWAVGALAVAGWAGAFAARRDLGADPGWVSGDVKPYWRDLTRLGTWSAVGAIIYWIFSQSYNYILASRVSLTAVADVNAARLLLMPTFVLTIGVKSLMVPSAAKWLNDSGISNLSRRLTLFIVGITAIDLIYFAFVWICRDWLTHDFMHKSIADRDRLLFLWAIISLLGLIRDMYQCALIALERFKPMAWLTAASACVSLTMVWLGLAWWGPAAALIGQIMGETVSLVGVLLLLWQSFRTPTVCRQT